MNVHEYPVYQHLPSLTRVEVFLPQPGEWYCIAVFIDRTEAIKYMETRDNVLSIRVRDAAKIENQVIAERIREEHK